MNDPTKMGTLSQSHKSQHKLEYAAEKRIDENSRHEKVFKLNKARHGKQMLRTVIKKRSLQKTATILTVS